MKDLLSVLEEFPKKRIAVIGDIMLDHYFEGKITRISPEAPIPIILVENEWFAPGGAGNTAVNAADLEATALLVGRVGGDIAGIRVLVGLEKKVNTNHVLIVGETIEKMRGLTTQRQVARFDKEKNFFLDHIQEDKIIKFISGNIRDWDAILISDYEKGFIYEYFARELVRVAKEHQKMLIVDTKPKHFLWFKGCYCVKPNKVEAEEFTGIKIEDLESAERAGFEIKKRLETNVLLTLGSMGMMLFEEERTTHFTSSAKEVFDVTGAGDTVLATFGLALASGASMRQAADLANHAAAIVITKPGTASVSLEELKKSIS